MSLSNNRYEGGLKSLKRIFMAATLLFITLATIFVIAERNRRVLKKTIQELGKANAGLEGVKTAILNRRNALTTIKAQLVPDNEKSSSERQVYGKVDEIIARFEPNDMTITTLERKGENVSLPFTLKFSNPNYSDFLNNVGQMQRSVFPFTPINSIALTQTEQNGKWIVEYTLTGSVLTVDRNGP